MSIETMMNNVDDLAAKAAFCYKEMFGEELDPSLKFGYEPEEEAKKHNRGGYFRAPNEIFIKEGLDPYDETAALCHELAHYWAMQQSQWGKKRVGKWSKERRIKNPALFYYEWSYRDGRKLFELTLKNNGLPSNSHPEYLNSKRVVRMQQKYELHVRIAQKQLLKSILGI